MEQLKLPETVEDQIVDWLKQNRYSLAWLAREIGVSEPHLHHILKTKGKNKKRLKPDVLERINKRLDTTFQPTDNAIDEQQETAD